MKVKCLRSDNGGEYDKSEFKAFYAAEGIRLMRTIPGKARQNVIAERMKKEYEYTLWAAQNTLGGCCEHNCILDQQGTISSFKVQDSRVGVDRKRFQVLTLKDFWLHFLCSC